MEFQSFNEFFGSRKKQEPDFWSTRAGIGAINQGRAMAGSEAEPLPLPPEEEPQRPGLLDRMKKMVGLGKKQPQPGRDWDGWPEAIRRAKTLFPDSIVTKNGPPSP
jgi:hypothetical protein